MNDSISADYLSEMKKIYTIDTSVMSGMDWFFAIISVVATLGCVIVMGIWIVTLLLFLISCLRGKRSINDSFFWKRMGASLIVIMLFMSGAIFMFLSKAYGALIAWGWTS
ncbi:hypothetical protein [Paenibacillus woosongensis]|uniref:Uncharacterized protein n=1 Tax=Paenibacillus woosongensis TaxID=307580 RepID=A0ABQ4MZ06_9BACL|nr:hypothetical protein [Paenibacillus woosongensis]GIP61142.1 hypothetical protein J15TS10_49560 [Paenibacillus woosongensis]